MDLKQEFLIQRQGKTYVLYQGLLDAAHERGLSSIDTEIIQTPTAENGSVAIVRAIVEMANMDDEAVTHRHFSGIGDASPDNVSKQMFPHILRMAETRAKARALRDAINVGVTALEELSDEPVGEVSGAIGEEGATKLYKHMLAHGWSSSDVGNYEESHKPLAEHTQEEGRKLWQAVGKGVVS